MITLTLHRLRYLRIWIARYLLRGLSPNKDSFQPWIRCLQFQDIKTRVFGEEHYAVARCSTSSSKNKDLQDIIAILGMEELSDEDKLAVSRPVKFNDLTQPMFVAEAFTQGRKYVTLETVRGFKEILDGVHDSKPEQAFIWSAE